MLHLDHGFSVRGHKNSIIFEVERQYAIDRITKQHVSAYGDESRNGFLFSSRSALANKKSFTYWHVNYDVPIEMSFTKKELINDLEVYVYEGTLLADQTQNLTNLSGVPEAYGIQTEADLKLYIEPNTGYLVNYEDTAVAWYVDQETGEKNMPWNSFSNTYSDLSLSFHVGEAQQQKSIYHFKTPTNF